MQALQAFYTPNSIIATPDVTNQPAVKNKIDGKWLSISFFFVSSILRVQIAFYFLEQKKKESALQQA